MKSYFDGNGTCGDKWHMIQYFDGFRIRESSVRVFNGEIVYTEKKIPGILETGINYRTAKRRIAAYEERATRRIG